MSSIEEASGSIATNAEGARELAGSITSSKDLLDELAASLDAIGVETTAQRTHAAGDRAEELAGHAHALADALDSLRQQVDALKGLLANAIRGGPGNAHRGPTDSSGSAVGAAAQEPLPLKGPAATTPPTAIGKRHLFGQIRMNSPAKEKNTVALPNVDTDADIAAIKTGQATHLRDNLYQVNGRTYGLETPSGTVYPVRGKGFVELDKLEFTALKGLLTYRGDRAAAERDPKIARFRRHMTDKTWETARNVFDQGQERA